MFRGLQATRVVLCNGAEIARKPVKPPDDDVPNVIAPDYLEYLLQARTLKVLA